MEIFRSVIIGVIVIAILIILDLGTKLLTALNKSNNGFVFDWSKLLLFYKTGVAPYFGIWLLYSLINIAIYILTKKFGEFTIPGFAEEVMAGIIYAAWSLIALKVGNSIFENLKDLGIKQNQNSKSFKQK